MNFIDVVKEKATAKQITVYETSDFSIFNLNPCNRKINEKKVNDFMQQDIKDVIYPISSTGEILDGQHRIRACEKLGKSVKFQIIDNADADYIHDINTVGSVWNNADFMHHYSKRNFIEYKNLNNFVDYLNKSLPEKNLGIVTVCIALLSGQLFSEQCIRVNQNYSGDYKNGKFKIRSIPNWVENAIRLNIELNQYIAFAAIRKQTPRKFMSDLYNFVMVLQSWGHNSNYFDECFESFKNSMILNMTNLPKMIQKCGGDYISVFSEIRNKNKKIKFDYSDSKKIYIQRCEKNYYSQIIEMYFYNLQRYLKDKYGKTNHAI